MERSAKDIVTVLCCTSAQQNRLAETNAEGRRMAYTGYHSPRNHTRASVALRQRATTGHVGQLYPLGLGYSDRGPPFDFAFPYIGLRFPLSEIPRDVPYALQGGPTHAKQPHGTALRRHIPVAVRALTFYSRMGNGESQQYAP